MGLELMPLLLNPVHFGAIQQFLIEQDTVKDETGMEDK
jgi:hypothetical protein